MKVKIIQNAGLGDILFCQKIAIQYMQNKNVVYWPILPQLSYVKDYIKNGIIWEDCTSPDLVLALHPSKTMIAKYASVNIPYKDWQVYFKFERNIEKENKLFDLYYTKQPYNLIAESFGTPPNSYQIKINPVNDLATIKINIGEEFTPFDYCRLIEEATELHFVDTCFTYFIEILQTKARRTVLYCRRPFNDSIVTKELWSKPFEYMEKNEF